MIISFNQINLLDHTELVLTWVRSTIAGSPKYFKKHPIPKHPRDLKDHNCLIATHISPTSEWKFNKNLKVIVHGNFSCDNKEILAQAAVDGLGLISTSTAAIASELKTGSLQTVLQDYQPKDKPIYVYINNNKSSKTLKLFTEYLMNFFK